MQPTGKQRILLADGDHRNLKFLQEVLSKQSSFDLAGVFGDLRHAVDSVPLLKPDVAIVGVTAGQHYAMDAIRLIREYSPDVALILQINQLSDVFDSKSLAEFFSGDLSGKASMVRKAASGSEDSTYVSDLLSTIRDVCEGRTVLDPAIIKELASSKGRQERSLLQSLTVREMDVLTLMAKAHANNAIARMLGIQPRTVEVHINSIFSKLRVSAPDSQHPRVQAVLTYLEGMGQNPIREMALSNGSNPSQNFQRSTSIPTAQGTTTMWVGTGQEIFGYPENPS